MSRQISVSDEAYDILMQMKDDKRSFSDVIKEIAGKRADKDKDRKTIMKFFGLLKGDKKLAELQKIIEKEREENYGRSFNW